MNRVQAEAATTGVRLKKAFLKLSQNSQENTCARVSFLKSWQACNNWATASVQSINY